MARQTFAQLYEEIANEWLATKPDLAGTVTPVEVVTAYLLSHRHGGSFGYNPVLLTAFERAFGGAMFDRSGVYVNFYYIADEFEEYLDYAKSADLKPLLEQS